MVTNRTLIGNHTLEVEPSIVTVPEVAETAPVELLSAGAYRFTAPYIVTTATCEEKKRTEE